MGKRPWWRRAMIAAILIVLAVLAAQIDWARWQSYSRGFWDGYSGKRQWPEELDRDIDESMGWIDGNRIFNYIVEHTEPAADENDDPAAENYEAWEKR